MDVAGSALTLSAWVKADDWNGDARIISKANGTAESAHWWMLGERNNKLRFRLMTNGTTHTLIAGSGTLETNTWHHAAATYDGAMMKLFLDGKEVGSMAKTGTIDTSSTVNAWLGGNPDGSNFFDGTIDDVRIYDTALTLTEIEALAGTATLTTTSSPSPTATLQGTPTTIGQGDVSTLTWSSENASSCTGTNFSTGGATSGSVLVAPSQTTTYTVTCDTASESLTVTVIDPAALPTIDFPGISGTFTWTTENADSCTASGDWSGTQDTGGSQTFSLPGLGSFTLTCTGAGGTVTRTLTITTDTAASSLASTKFSEGERVTTTDALNARSSASLSGTLLGTQPQGATGTIVGGPTEADGYWWWQIDYDDAPDGWSAENWLAAL